MHTFSESGTGVPAFLAKLWRLVEDPETNDLISWSTDGRSFIIQNQAQFAKELLPLNYKHNNMASFIRQLNMYGFHKITSIDNGGLRFDRDEMEFTHPCFQKDHPYLLEHIKRKIATSKQQQQLQAQQAADDKSALKLEAVSRVLSEVKNMRGRQDSLDSRFQAMKQENEALWREVAILRQKHHKQQQIVNKLIQFLVTIVQPSRGGLGSMGNGNNKRRFQLMINDAPQQAKLKKSDYSDGATIEELGEALEEVAYANQQELLSSQDKGDKKENPVVSAQIVRTSPPASTSASSGTVVSKGSQATSSNSAALGGGRRNVNKLDGSSITKDQKVPPILKSARSSEIPEITSPMSFIERSPYHRTATPAMSTGGSSTRSSNGGNGSEAGEINETFEEVFSPMPQYRSTGGSGSVGGGSSLAGGRGMVKVEKHGHRQQQQHQQHQPQYVMRSLNTGRRGAGAPTNLAQLIEDVVDGDELESYSDIVDQEADVDGETEDGLDEAEVEEADRDTEQQGYLVDHVDEIDPRIVQLYQDSGENDMMLNTPMVIREMERQEQLKQQRQKDRQQQQQQATHLGKRGDSLLKGGASSTSNKRQGEGSGNSERSQKSLLNSVKVMAGAGVRSSGSGAQPPPPSTTPMIVTRGGKKLALANAAKKQANTNGDQQQQQQQSDGTSPGPSRYQSTASTHSPTPPISDTSAACSTFTAEDVGNTSSYVTASDILPGDIFEISNDQSNLDREEADTRAVMVKDTNPSPMLNGYSFIDGGYYNPNVNINNIKASRQQQLQQQQQQQQLQVQQGLVQGAQQSPAATPGTPTTVGGGNEDYEGNKALDSSMLQTPRGPSGSNDQQISKFVSSDSDVSRLNTVAEYGQHIDTVQTDLESLKELLKGEGYQLDANALLGNTCSTAPPYGRVYFPSGPFDSDTINKLFNNNDEMLGYDFPMNLPDLMTDDQQQQNLQQHLTLGALQQQQQQPQQQQLLQQNAGNSSNNSEKSGPSDSPSPPGRGQISPVSPMPSAHTQLMAYKLGGHTGGAGTGINNGFFGPGIHGGAIGNGNGGGGVDCLANGVMMDQGGPLGIVSGDYIDLNELLSMDANGGHDEDNSSMVA